LSTRFPEHATRLSHIDYNSNVQALLLFFSSSSSPLYCCKFQEQSVRKGS
jgi:hypothetical protein